MTILRALIILNDLSYSQVAGRSKVAKSYVQVLATGATMLAPRSSSRSLQRLSAHFSYPAHLLQHTAKVTVRGHVILVRPERQLTNTHQELT
jgi:hypothetical protein